MPFRPGALHEIAVLIRHPALRSKVARRRIALPPFLRSNIAICHGIRLQSTETRSPGEGVLDQSLNPVHLASRSQAQSLTTVTRKAIPPGPAAKLPTTCPGCGALSQTTGPDEPGFYSRSRKAVKNFLQRQISFRPQEDRLLIENTSHEQAGANTDNEGRQTAHGNQLDQGETPVCDRCHDLVYNNQGRSIAHPSVENLADSISESPFNRNHVYHVLDAADFPMSLIPKVFRSLELAKPRSQNRRARTKFTTKPTVSFVITRSDLLGPSKEMVDKMMPYFQDVLRSALGRLGRDMRLGNIHLVSATRGWWTKELKDSIWERGGGNWMVGKVNVGKSNLFPVLFPKGSGERAPIYAELRDQPGSGKAVDSTRAQQNSNLEIDTLLPPAQPEVPFPTMPVVSHLPGTTASPIRLPFGNQKGELIDLPGVERGNLEQYVHPDHKQDLVMQFRPNVKQHIIKPGQSLLLGGGLIRITPYLDTQDRSITMLAYPFLPIDVHVTSTEKAVALEGQLRHSGIKSIVADGVGFKMKSAGKYSLETDVTKSRASALVRAGVPVSKLPFRVYSSDILIEGVGWVELVCQVRRSKFSLADSPVMTPHHQENSINDEVSGIEPQQTLAPQQPSQSEFSFKPFVESSCVTEPSTMESPKARANDGFSFPSIEVFSPQGEHIGHRKPLGAWMLWHEANEQRRRGTTTIRPRRSMKGEKKRQKVEGRS